MAILVIFEIIGEIEQIETMSVGGNVHDIMRLQKNSGRVDENSRVCHGQAPEWKDWQG